LDAPDYGAPCGACRQVIHEFGKDMTVIMGKECLNKTVNGKQEIVTISELLPFAFNLES